MEGNGYVITSSHRGDGIGSRLLKLAEAVWLARELGRAVIVDWRKAAFLKDRSLNYFTEFFEPAPQILGVPIFYAPSPEVEHYEQVGADQRLLLNPLECARLLTDSASTPPYLVAKGTFALKRLPEYDAVQYNAFLEDFYRSIIPRAELTRRLETWYDANLRGHFVVGVNVSTGNGIFARGARKEGRVQVGIFEDHDRFLGTIARACDRAARRLPEPLRRGYKIFFATDSSEMSELLGRLPRAVTRRSVFPPPGIGHHFRDYDRLGYSDHDAAADMIIDMLLLGRCDALVKNQTNFSSYALVSTHHFSGNVQDLEALYPTIRMQAKARLARTRMRQAAGRAIAFLA